MSAAKRKRIVRMRVRQSARAEAFKTALRRAEDAADSFDRALAGFTYQMAVARLDRLRRESIGADK